MPQIYLGDALEILFGSDAERKNEFRKTTDSLKSLGWAFERFDGEKKTVYFRKGEWSLAVGV